MKVPSAKDTIYVGLGVLVGFGVFLLIWLLFLKKKAERDEERREQNYSDGEALSTANDPAVRQLGRDLTNAQTDLDTFSTAEMGTTAAAGILAGGAVGLLIASTGAVAAGVVIGGVVCLAVAAATYALHSWIDDKMLKSLEEQRDELREGTWPGTTQQELVPDGEGGFKTRIGSYESIEPGTKEHPPVQGQKIPGEEPGIVSPPLTTTTLSYPGLTAVTKDKE